jgi:hypothetical protein
VLNVCIWLWGTKYSEAYVDRLVAGIGRHLHQPHRIIYCRPEGGPDAYLLTHKGCFVRLRMFDPAWQAEQGISEGERLICIDLDTVITGPLDELFLRPEPFVILQGANAANPCPYNGSVWMLAAGYRPDVWSDFSIEAAAKTPFYESPDDQGWFWHKIPDAAGWQVGTSGIYAFRKPAWPSDDALPSNARIVAFPGARDPWMFTYLDWVRANWARG